MSQRTDLLASIANTIQDYRGGSLPQPIPDHVERWVQQFDASVQLPILQEIDHVLKKIYFSKEDVAKFLCGAMRTQKLTGDKPDKFWRSASFLDIQGGGSSQTDMLALFSEQLEDKHGFGIDDCGQGDEVFIYLDDGIFTGNRVRRDLENWIRDHAPVQATVHVTYRNCPNNAPLAFWVGEPWYPLFPRTTNTQTAVRKMFANLTGGNL